MSQQLEHNFDQELHRLKVSALSQPLCPEQPTAAIQPAVPGVSQSSAISRFPKNPTTQLEDQCEQRYGMELVNIWGKNEEIWCASDAQDGEQKSELKCYPYHQAHKKLDGRGPDLVCEATNFIIDFDKISGEIVTHGKPSKGTEYLRFTPGSLQSTCKTTPKYQSRLFMAHHAMQMRGFEPGTSSLQADTVVPTTTYLLARDEDCENSFHSTADFMNMLLVYRMLGLDEKEVQVMLFDRFSNGPYLELIQKAFSPQHPVLRHTYYKGKVLFKRLVFHLESPAGLIFPKVSRPDPLRCHHTSLFEAYRRHVLQAFNLLDVAPPPIPSVTLSLRHRSKEKNVGRVMGNEDEVVSVLKKGNLLDLRVVDTAKMSYSEQLKLIRNTNVLIGIHGAGLMFIMFAADEAVLVEIHPSYRQDRHFRHAARMTGKIYMPIRSTRRETCVGSSDTVTVPIEEFERTVDGAVRIARSFDDGLSECGLVCPPAILALDGRLDRYYKSHERKSTPINTRFPC
eukprot:gene18298-20835_t